MHRKSSALRRRIWVAGIAVIGFSTAGGAQIITGTPGAPDAQTVPIYLQWDDPFDIGQDTGSSVNDADYKVPFAFTGKLDNVTFKLGESTMPRPAAAQKTAQNDIRD